MEVTTPGPVRPGAGITWQIIGRVVQNGDCGPFCCSPRKAFRPAFHCYPVLTKSVEHGWPDLECIRAAQLLNWEADLKRACQSVDDVKGSDRDLRCDVQRPIDQNGGSILGRIHDLQRPRTTGALANQTDSRPVG